MNLNKRGSFLPDLKYIPITRSEYGLLFVFLLIEFARGAFFLTFLPLYAANYLGISIAAAGLAVSAHFLAETCTKAAAGWQLDRRGHSIMLSGLLLGLLALLLMRAYPSVPVLLVGSALLGLGISPVWLAVVSTVAPVELKGRASRMGVIYSLWLIGGGGGPAIINFFITRGYSFAFWFLIFLWGLALLVSIALLPGAKKKRHSASSYSFIKEIITMLRQQAVIKILLPGMFLQTLTGGLLLPLLPLYAQDQLGMAPNQYALLLLIGGAAAALSFLPMGRLADRVNLRLILSTGFGLCALFLAIFSLVHNPTSAYLLAALIGFSYAAVLPAWNNLLAKAVPPDGQATGWSVFSTIEGLGIATGPAIGGLVAKYLGFQAPLIMGTVILAFMACFYLLYPIEKLFSEHPN